MKKVLKFLIVCLVGIGFVFFSSKVLAEATDSSDVDANVKALLTKYYNNGTYIKESKINLNEDAVHEGIQFFHAKSTELERTTFYKGDSLWMSRGIKDEYSYYGTAYEGETAIGVTNATASSPLSAPENASVVLSGTGKESMENYYVTMNDFIELTYETGWQENNGVYSYIPNEVVNNDEFFTKFRLFTAPCYLEPTEENSNYLTFAKATLEEVNNSLVLSLYVSSSDAGKVTSTKEKDGTYLFSQAKVTASSDFVGTGTENDPYIIYNHETWKKYAEAILNKTDNFKNKHFKVVKDFTVEGNTKIGIMDFQFAGIFDGNGHTITYNMSFTSGESNQGLFGTISNTAIIRNLKVAGTLNTLNTGNANIGSIVGINKGGLIENCESSVVITAKGARIGGIAAVCDGGKILNSVFKGTITTTSTAAGNTDRGVGGIVALLSSAGVAEISNCTNEGTINATCRQVAGIVGFARGTSAIRHTISNCVNNGNITSTSTGNDTANEGVAGIVAVSFHTNINNCENNGVITAKTSAQVGGIVGKCCDGSSVKNCVNNSTVIAIQYVGGIAGRHVGSGTTMDGCTNNGDIYCTSTTSTYYGQIYGQNGATVTNCTENGSKGTYTE